MNGKFIEKYGTAWAQMDSDMKMMSIMSEIYDLRETIEPFRPTCETVKRHSLYFKGIFWTCGIIIACVLTWLITSLLGLIG